MTSCKTSLSQRFEAFEDSRAVVSSVVAAGIARHKVEDYYRERLRTIGDLNLDDESLPPPASHPAFEERLDRERRTDKTHRILAKLPEPYGLVLLWRYWERRSTKEMSERTGRTEKAIERLLARARARFRQLWEAE